MKKYTFYPAIALLLLLVVTACGRKTPSPSHPYVAGTTTGNVGVNEKIVVKLADDAHLTTPAQPGEELPKGVVKFSPRVPGKAVWGEQNTILFTPEKPLAYDQKYTVEVNLSKVMDVGKTPSRYVFEVTTLPPHFNTYHQGLTMYPDAQADIYYLSGIVATNAFVDNESAEKMLDIQSPKKLTATWTHNADGTLHTFVIDSIRAVDKPYNLTLAYRGKPIGSSTNAEDVIAVPKRGVFQFLDLSIEYDPEFRVVASFSGAIADNQRLSNYLTISPETPLRFVSELNKIYIYPSSRVVGTYKLSIDAGLSNTQGKTLAETIQREVVFEEITPAVRFLGKGSILPSSNNQKMPFQAVNFARVEVRVTRIFQNNILQFLQENDLNGSYEIYRVGREVVNTTIKLGDPASPQLRRLSTYSLDLSTLIAAEPGAIYQVMIRGLDPLITESDDDDEDGEGDYYDSYFGSYDTREERTRNILASDIGIIAKADDQNNVHVYVTNLITAQPESGAVVKLYDYTNQLLAEGHTDANGFVQIKSPRSPHVVVVQQGDGFGYLKVNEGSNLSMSEFDVGGETVKGGVKCFIYGERGVWRPGDDIYLSLILMDREKSLPKDHPIKVEFMDPRSQIIQTQVLSQGVNGLYTTQFSTSPDAMTGNYTARVSVGNLEFRKNIRIETVKPNRLKIDFTLNDKTVLPADNIQGKIHSEWLHGAKAPGLETKVELALSSAETKFKGFDDYIFRDKTKRFESEDKEIFAGKLDENGDVSFTKSLEGVSTAPGMLNAKFTVRVFEKSGDFSTDQYSTLCTPYPVFVGLRTPQATGYSDMIETDRDHTFNIVTLSPSGTLTDTRNLEVEISRIEWVWWWNSSEEGEASYIQNNYNKPIFSKTLSATGGKVNFNYKWAASEWGLYLIKVTDPNGGHSTSQICYVDWPSSHREQNGRASAAVVLNLKADKSSYKVGETAQITFPSAAGARALLTVESGSRVISSSWHDLAAGSTTIPLKITSEMTPNVYAYITQIQPHANTLNDAPMRLYGVIPIAVEDDATKLNPVVEVPAVLRPEKEFEVTVRESKGRAMSYTIAIVDEGLLDLTRFKTPDPWRAFFAREALGIRTWDLFDYVIGAYGGRIEQVFSIGGDDEIIAKGDKKAQRFKPVVKFLGPFTLKKGGVDKHKVTLPPYVGAVRTMVVASSEESAFGTAETRSQVKKPLMVMTTLPRVVGTDEVIQVPVTVFAMENSVRTVDVTIKAVDGFTIEGSQTKQVTFSSEGDKIVYFTLKAKSATGIGRVNVVATTPGDMAQENLEIEIRDPNPRTSNFTLETLEGGASYTGNFNLVGKLGSNAFTLEVSAVPPMNLTQRLGYLLAYPHGCLEQTTSAAFPQLYLSSVADTDEQTNKRSQTNVQAAIERLSKFQTSSGLFSYWPGSYVNSWANVYAGHFLFEAKRLGYSVPSYMWNQWLTATAKEAREWSTNDNMSGVQAYRLYVLALAGAPEAGAMNRLKEMPQAFALDTWLLAGAYAASGRVDVARGMIAKLSTEVLTTKQNSYSFGSHERDMSVVIMVLQSIGQSNKAFPLVMKLSEKLNSNQWMSTQTSAWALMAMAAFTSNSSERDALNFEYQIADSRGSEKSPKSVKEVAIDVSSKAGAIPIRVKNNSTQRIYIRMTSQGVPLKGEEVSRADNLTIEVRYKLPNGTVIDPTSLNQGTDFIAEVTVQNPGLLGYYENLVLSQVFPSGWEIRGSKSVDGASVNYQDIRDDRVYSYFNLDSRRAITIRTELTATYAGRFYLPAVICEAMYDGSIYASTVGEWCEVAF